jgi:hypothetical protein
MITRRVFSVISGLVLALVMLAPVARADERDKASKLTFNQPFEIPGNKILAAGTYWFVTMPELSSAGRNIVQIFDADRSKLYTTVITIPTERQTSTENTEVTLTDPAGNQPKALLSWFYPESHVGHEFVYGPQEEKILSAESVIRVLATPAQPAYGD